MKSYHFRHNICLHYQNIPSLICHLTFRYKSVKSHKQFILLTRLLLRIQQKPRRFDEVFDLFLYIKVVCREVQKRVYVFIINDEIEMKMRTG